VIILILSSHTLHVSWTFCIPAYYFVLLPIDPDWFVMFCIASYCFVYRDYISARRPNIVTDVFARFSSIHLENAKQTLTLGHYRLIPHFIQRIIHYIYFILSTAPIIWIIGWSLNKQKINRKHLFLSTFLLSSYPSFDCSIFVGPIYLGRTGSHSSPISSTFYLGILRFIHWVSVALAIHSTESNHFLSPDELLFCFTCVCI
jgi:hypothetical protein